MLNTDKPFKNEFIGLKTHVEYLRDEVIEKYQQLVPIKRIKRGILNPLGSFIKVISGNLDHEDAVRYDKLISEIHNREQATSNKITLISEIMDHFLNSTVTINNNTIIMKERLSRVEKMVKDISTKENNAIYSTYVLGLLNLFITNFRTLYIKLSEIETALAFGKLEVLHKSIINPIELSNVLKFINKHNSLMYSVNEENIINIEETLSVKSYMKQDQIMFIIEVPLTSNSSYNYFKLFPLPISKNSQTIIVIPDFPFLIVEGTTYRPLARPCKEITADEYLCTENELIPYLEESCIEQLMKYNTELSHCSPRRIESEKVKIQRISTNSWIVYVKQETVLTQTCGNDVTHQPIQGTYVITLQQQCNIHVGSIQLYEHKFHSLQSEYKAIPVINLPDLHFPEQEHAEPVDLKGINLDEVQHLNYLLKKSVISESAISGINTKSISLGTLVLYVIVITALSVLCIKYRLVLYSLCYKRDCQQLVAKKDSPASDESAVDPRPLLLK